MPIRAVIFDRDGVLTYFDINKASAFYKPLLSLDGYEVGGHLDKWGKANGFPRTTAQEKIFWDEFWKYLCDFLKVSAEVHDKVAKVHYTEFMAAFPEVKPVMLALKQLGMKIGVLSNFSLASLEESLTVLNLIDLVDYSITAISLGISKPHPDSYLTMTKALGVDPKECLFLDDEFEHIDGAKAIGMQAYLVQRDKKNDDLSQHILHNLSAVPTIVEDYNKGKG